MTADLTGIENVGEFFSQHYLDELLLGDLRDLQATWRDRGDRSPPDRLRALSRDFFRAYADAARLSRPDALYDASHDLQVRLAEALGYAYAPHAYCELDHERALPLVARVDRQGEPFLFVVEGRFRAEAEGLLDTPLVPAQLPKPAADAGLTLPTDPLAKLLAAAFALERHPRFIVVLSGTDILLAERARFGRGRWLRFELPELLGRRDPKALEATAALLCKDALAPDDGTPLHDTLDENSHKHAYGVSSDLKYAARRAVELLGNEWVHYQRTVGKKRLYGDRVARELTEECLVYLYRLLFLFYAEARATELGRIPMNSEEYRQGYSLEALRDLEMVPLTTPEAQNGTFLHDSLERLFRLVNDGFHPAQTELAFHLDAEDRTYDERGFRIDPMHSPLFDPKRTPRLSSIKMRNQTLQEVIRLLSLSRERRRGKRGAWGRGRISYAQLGINQLGAVYEGLLSYTGFFAKETLYEVHRAGERTADETAQAFFVPESELDRYTDDELLFHDDDDHPARRKYDQGTFIFRLAGRDRETSASYYTPEVLTDCLVKYSLKELLADGEARPEDASHQHAGGVAAKRPGTPLSSTKTADDILALTVCEPAMGSGAFLVEALDQLAEAYLDKKQEELGETIPPDRYAHEKQRVQSHLAAHNCYGVDLNPMATRLAGVSLWLATMHEGQDTPWYDARLAIGNSLVGARLEVWDATDLDTDDPLRKALTKVLKRHGGKPTLEAHVETHLAAAPKESAHAVQQIRDLFARARRALEAATPDDAPDPSADVSAETPDPAPDVSAETPDAAAAREQAHHDQLAKDLKKLLRDLKLPRHHTKPPRPVPLRDIVERGRPPGTIYHFLLPDAGMSPFDSDKAIKDLVPDAVETLKAWRKTLTDPYAKPDATRLLRISDRIDDLLRRHATDRDKALDQSRARTPVWGQPDPTPPAMGWPRPHQRARLLAATRAPDSAYDRLRRVMDLWVALWAWPLQHTDRLPTRAEIWTEIERLLDLDGPDPLPLEEQLRLLDTLRPPPSDDDPDDPPAPAPTDLASIVDQVRTRIRPHHWELEFPEVFQHRGGFDLVVGNPPWIRLDWNESGVLSDLDPRVELDKLSSTEVAKRRATILEKHGVDRYLEEAIAVQGYQAFLASLQSYPLLQGVRTNLYKCFITRGWQLGSPTGVVGLIHQDGIFDDPKGGALRAALVHRRPQVYRFKNEFKLFADVNNGRPYCLSCTTAHATAVQVRLIANLFHPRTIDQSWTHDGAGDVPGIKTDDNHFETRGHKSRLVIITDRELLLFASLFDAPGTNALEARLPIVHSREVVEVLRKLDAHPRRLRCTAPRCERGHRGGRLVI